MPRQPKKDCRLLFLSANQRRRYDTCSPPRQHAKDSKTVPNTLSYGISWHSSAFLHECSCNNTPYFQFTVLKSPPPVSGGLDARSGRNEVKKVKPSSCAPFSCLISHTKWQGACAAARQREKGAKTTGSWKRENGLEMEMNNDISAWPVKLYGVRSIATLYSHGGHRSLCV